MELENEKQHGITNDGADLNSFYMQKFKLYETRSVYILVAFYIIKSCVDFSFSIFFPWYRYKSYVHSCVIMLMFADAIVSLDSVFFFNDQIHIHLWCPQVHSWILMPYDGQSITKQIHFLRLFLNWDLDACHLEGFVSGWLSIFS